MKFITKVINRVQILMNINKETRHTAKRITEQITKKNLSILQATE